MHGSPGVATQCFAWMYVSGLSFLHMPQSGVLQERKWP